MDQLRTDTAPEHGYQEGEPLYLDHWPADIFEQMTAAFVLDGLPVTESVLPDSFELPKVLQIAKGIQRKSRRRGDVEIAASFGIDPDTRHLVRDQVVIGDEESVDPEFSSDIIAWGVIHNHPDTILDEQGLHLWSGWDFIALLCDERIKCIGLSFGGYFLLLIKTDNTPKIHDTKALKNYLQKVMDVRYQGSDKNSLARNNSLFSQEMCATFGLVMYHTDFGFYPTMYRSPELDPRSDHERTRFRLHVLPRLIKAHRTAE